MKGTMTCFKVLLLLVVLALASCARCGGVALMGEVFTSIVFVANMCDYKNQVQVGDFEIFWNSSFAGALETYTHGNVRMGSRDQNRVVNISIPCRFKSVTSNRIVDYMNLELSNFTNYNEFVYEWSSYALKYATAVLRLKVEKFKYRTMLLPTNVSMPWYGLGVVGCEDTNCLTWIVNDHYNPKIYMHEYGHNWGMGHSWKNGNEYGDEYSVMGNYNAATRFIAPHTDMLNWTHPIASVIAVNGTDNVVMKLLSTINNRSDYIKVNDNIFVELENTASARVYELLSQDASTNVVCTLDASCRQCTLNKTLLVFSITIVAPNSVELCVGFNTTACIPSKPQSQIVNIRSLDGCNRNVTSIISSSVSRYSTVRIVYALVAIVMLLGSA